MQTIIQSINQFALALQSIPAILSLVFLATLALLSAIRFRNLSN
jgi:hypothetical protein